MRGIKEIPFLNFMPTRVQSAVKFYNDQLMTLKGLNRCSYMQLNMQCLRIACPSWATDLTTLYSTSLMIELTSVVHQNAAILPTPDLVPPDNRVAPRSDLNARVHVIEYVIFFQGAVTIVIEINTNLEWRGKRKLYHQLSAFDQYLAVSSRPSNDLTVRIASQNVAKIPHN